MALERLNSAATFIQSTKERGRIALDGIGEKRLIYRRSAAHTPHSQSPEAYERVPKKSFGKSTFQTANTCALC